MRYIKPKFSVIASNKNNVYANLLAGQVYYILLKNSTATSYSITLSINYNLDTIIVGNDNSLSMNGAQEYALKFVITATGRYDFDFCGTNIYNLGIEIYKQGVSSPLTYTKAIEENFMQIRTDGGLTSGTYYIKLAAPIDTSFNIGFAQYTTSYYCEIDGQRYIPGSGITRGIEHSIKLFNNKSQPIYKGLKVNTAYSPFTILSYSEGVYTFTIEADAKMYIDTATYFCRLSTYNDENIYIEFPVIYQVDSINLRGKSLSDFTGKSTITYNNPAVTSNEKVVVHCNYKFDNGTEYTLQRNIGAPLSFNTDTLPYFSLNDYFNVAFTVDRIVFYASDGTTTTGIVYNKSLSKYSGKINAILIPSIVVGIHYESGTGTSLDPYVIDNYLQFNHIKYAIKIINNESVITDSFKINFINYYGGTIGEVFNCTFKGTLVGSGPDTIGSYPINARLSNGDIGLFRKIGSTGVIQNFGLIFRFSIGVSSVSNSIGRLSIENHGTIQNCQIGGTFSGSSYETRSAYFGGITARNYGTIYGCTATGISNCGAQYMGGIAGYSSRYVQQCTSQVRLKYHEKATDNDCIGGVVGKMAGGEVSGCTFTDTIGIYLELWKDRNYQPYVGGIVGYKIGGEFFYNVCNKNIATINVDALNPDVSWWSWFVTYHHNQREYVGYWIGNPKTDG